MSFGKATRGTIIKEKGTAVFLISAADACPQMSHLDGILAFY